MFQSNSTFSYSIEGRDGIMVVYSVLDCAGEKKEFVNESSTVRGFLSGKEFVYDEISNTGVLWAQWEKNLWQFANKEIKFYLEKILWPT